MFSFPKANYPEMVALRELRSALSLPRPADNEVENTDLESVGDRGGIQLGPILSRLRLSDNHEG